MVKVKLKEDSPYSESRENPKINSIFETTGVLKEIRVFNIVDNKNILSLNLRDKIQLYDILNNENYTIHRLIVDWDNGTTNTYILQDLVILNENYICNQPINDYITYLNR